MGFGQLQGDKLEKRVLVDLKSFRMRVIGEVLGNDHPLLDEIVKLEFKSEHHGDFVLSHGMQVADLVSRGTIGCF